MITNRANWYMLFISLIYLYLFKLIEANGDIKPSFTETGANIKKLNFRENYLKKHSDHSHTRRGRCFFSSSSSYDGPPAGDDMYWNFNPRTDGGERNLGRLPPPPSQVVYKFVQ